MWEKLKNKLINFLLRDRIKPNYDDLSFEEKVELNGLWRDYGKINQKIAKIVVGDVIQNYARNEREVELAKDILTLQNDLVFSYYKMIEEEKAARNIV